MSTLEASKLALTMYTVSRFLLLSRVWLITQRDSVESWQDTSKPLLPVDSDLSWHVTIVVDLIWIQRHLALLQLQKNQMKSRLTKLRLVNLLTPLIRLPLSHQRLLVRPQLIHPRLLARLLLSHQRLRARLPSSHRRQLIRLPLNLQKLQARQLSSHQRLLIRPIQNQQKLSIKLVEEDSRIRVR